MEPIRRLNDQINSHTPIDTKNSYLNKIKKNKKINYTRIFDVAYKILEIIDLGFGVHKRPRAVLETRTVREIYDFYGTYRDFKFFFEPFSKEKIDQKRLRKSIDQSLRQHLKLLDIDLLVEHVFNQVMQKGTYRNKREVITEIKASLNPYLDEITVEKIAKRIIIRRKRKPALQSISNICFTIADLGGNLKSIFTWSKLDLSKFAATIGRQSPILKFVVNLGVGIVLGVAASVGYAASMGDASYRIYTHLKDLKNSLDPDERKKIKKELALTFLDLFNASANFVATLTPLLFTLNPPVVTALALVAKGIGLIHVCIR